MWTLNFQMFKLVLEKEEEPEIKLPTSAGSLKKQESSRKTSISAVLRAGGEGDERGWDGWTASPTRWTWVWVDSGSWWWTGRPGVLWFMGSQRVEHDWATEMNWTELLYWLHQSLWLCGSQQTVENSERDGNTRPPDLPLEKPVCRSGSNS